MHLGSQQSAVQGDSDLLLMAKSSPVGKPFSSQQVSQPESGAKSDKFDFSRKVQSSQQVTGKAKPRDQESKMASNKEPPQSFASLMEQLDEPVQLIIKASTTPVRTTFPADALFPAAKKGAASLDVLRSVHGVAMVEPLIAFQPEAAAPNKLSDFVNLIETQLSTIEKKLSNNSLWHPVPGAEDEESIIEDVASATLRRLKEKEKFTSYQQMLLRQEEISNAMTALKRREKKARQRIEQDEAESMRRIREAEEASMKRVRDMEAIFNDSLASARTEIAQEKDRLAEEQDRLQRVAVALDQLHKQRLAEFTVAASGLCAHHRKVTQERDTVSRMKVQLELALRSINGATHPAHRNPFPPSDSNAVMQPIPPRSSVVPNIEHRHLPSPAPSVRSTSPGRFTPRQTSGSRVKADGSRSISPDLLSLSESGDRRRAPSPSLKPFSVSTRNISARL